MKGNLFAIYNLCSILWYTIIQDIVSHILFIKTKSQNISFWNIQLGHELEGSSRGRRRRGKLAPFAPRSRFKR
jgi:hypothetical protein